MILSIYKAQATISTQPVEDLVVQIAEPIPDLRMQPTEEWQVWSSAALARFQRQGEALADALVRHLPGGTVDQLIRALLLHRASLFVVSFVDQPPSGDSYSTTTDPDLAPAEGGGAL